jgi:hypothetical protein
MRVRVAAAAIMGLAVATEGHATRAADTAPVVLARHAETTEVRARGALLGTVRHARGAVVRGDVLGAGAVVVADEDGGDYGAALWRVDARSARVLARGVYHASRPLVSRDGRVYVERGTPGPWPTPDEAHAGHLRTDALTLDAIDPETGAARTLYGWSGYTLHLAGETEREIVVYRVSFEGADLTTVDRASGSARVVTTLAPYARDFSVSRDAVVMSNRDQDRWTIDRVSLASGARERLFEAQGYAPVPRVLASGAVTWGTAAAPDEALDESVR